MPLKEECVAYSKHRRQANCFGVTQEGIEQETSNRATRMRSLRKR